MNPVSIMILHWVVSALALMLTGFLLPGFKVGSFISALFIALVIGFANVTIRPALLFLTLPFNVITLGLFTFVVDGIVLKICAAFMPNFDIKGWGNAILGAVILAIVGTALHILLV